MQKLAQIDNSIIPILDQLIAGFPFDVGVQIPYTLVENRLVLHLSCSTPDRVQILVFEFALKIREI